MTRRRAILTVGHRAPHAVRHEVRLPGWTLPPLTIALLSDFHVCTPWTPPAALGPIVAQTHALAPDLIVLGGDFIADRKLPAGFVEPDRIVAALSALRAPLGVHAVLGNHDWWDCRLSQGTGFRRNSVAEALEASPIRLLRNEGLRIAHGEGGFWLAGLDSQRALKRLGHPGLHDADAAFAGRDPADAAILVAHEPDYFANGDSRAMLQLSGHTHGGQINLMGWRPVVPSAHRARYAWGHVREGGRHLVVSGGIGFSGLPLRFLQPPEITLVRVTGEG